MLSPDDLRNPSLKSGYKNVRFEDVDGRPKPYVAQAGQKRTCVGPHRATAAESAQDYCDYVNGGPAPAPRTKRAGNRVRRDPIDDREVEAARGVLRDARAQRLQKAQGWVYCIGEEGRWDAVKIGYSVKPAARVAELQTGNPRKLVLLGAFHGTKDDEAAIHERYMEHNILLEWFRPTTTLLWEFGITHPLASVTRAAPERST